MDPVDNKPSFVQDKVFVMNYGQTIIWTINP